MENEKNLEEALMSDEELDFVAGGKGYVYMTETSNGKMDVVAFDKPLNKSQLANVLKTGALPKGLDGKNLRVMKGVRSSFVDKLKGKLNTQFKGCEFHNF
jgi:hypothetical protein